MKNGLSQLRQPFLSRPESCYKIAKVTVEECRHLCRGELARRDISGVAFRPKRKRVTVQLIQLSEPTKKEPSQLRQPAFILSH